MYAKILSSIFLLVLAGQAYADKTPTFLQVVSPPANSNYTQTELISVQINTDLQDTLQDETTGQTNDVKLDVRIDGPVKLDLGEHTPSQLKAGIQFNASYLSTDYFRIIVEGPTVCASSSTGKSCSAMLGNSFIFSVQSTDGKHHNPIEALDSNLDDQQDAETPYGIGNETLAYTDAAKYCTSRNFTLATIEYSTASTIAQELYRHTNGNPAWLKSYTDNNGVQLNAECLAIYANREGQIRVAHPKEGCKAKLDVLCSKH